MSKSIAIAYSMKKKAGKGKGCASGGTVESGDKTMNYAEGGEVEGGAPAWVCSKCGEHGNTFKGYQDGSKALDMIEKILAKRKMSHGGQVANDTDFTADEKPAEFDDLVLRDDEDLEGYTGENSGDEIGGPSKDDTVSRAMAKRKSKKKA